MIKNTNPVFNFSFFSEEVERRGGGGVARGGFCRGVGEIVFICDTLYKPNSQCFTFSSSYSIGIPSYGLHWNSLRNLSK